MSVQVLPFEIFTLLTTVEFAPLKRLKAHNAGLIGSLATHARVNDFGFIETPFFPVVNGQIIKDKPAVYMTADEEDDLRVAPGRRTN